MIKTKVQFLSTLVFTMFFTICHSQQNEQAVEKILIDIGDSLTAGAGGNGVSMSTVTQELLGSDWTVKNMGVGGENTLTIGARQGGIPMYIKESLTLLKDGSKVQIPTGLYSSYNDTNILPLLQGDAGINPVLLENIACELTYSNGNYYLNRLAKSDKNHQTKPGSKITTALSKEISGIATIFIGQNGTYNSPEDLLSQIDLFVQHKGDYNVIIITSHGAGNAETIRPIQEKYGEKVIDLKKYMATTAIYDAIKFGLLPDNGMYPTANDIEQMSINNAPPTLLSDFIHLNAIGYKLLGKLRYEKGISLGYW